MSEAFLLETPGMRNFWCTCSVSKMEKALTVDSKLSSGKIGVDNRFLLDTNFESMRLTSCLDLHCLRGSPSPSTCKYSKETRNIQRDLMQNQRRHKDKRTCWDVVLAEKRVREMCWGMKWHGCSRGRWLISDGKKARTFIKFKLNNRDERESQKRLFSFSAWFKNWVFLGVASSAFSYFSHPPSPQATSWQSFNLPWPSRLQALLTVPSMFQFTPHLQPLNLP